MSGMGFVQVYNKENVKALHYLPFMRRIHIHGGIHITQKVSLTRKVFPPRQAINRPRGVTLSSGSFKTINMRYIYNNNFRSRKYIWNYRLQNVVHFVMASVC